jgi:transposase
MEAKMDQFVGLDVSQEMTHLCVIGGDGKIALQGKCLSTPEDIAGTIRSKAPDVARIGLESGPLSTWHWHALKAMGLPIACLDSRHAQATMSGQVNKTDKNDAYGLAQIVKAGWYREVGVKSLDSHAVRSMLGARAQLVGMRVEVTNQIRGTLKTFGIVLSRRTEPLWNELFPAEQARIVELLVERVDLQPDGIDLRLRVEGLTSLCSELRGGASAHQEAA